MTRNQFLKVGLLSPLLGYTSLEGAPNNDIIEELAGDPGEPAESLQYSKRDADNWYANRSSNNLRKDPEKLFRSVLDISLDYAKQEVSRTHNEGKEVLDFLGLFGFSLKYKGTEVFVPYCAAGVSYAACLAYCQMEPKLALHRDAQRLLRSVFGAIQEHYFLPSPSVRAIVDDAKSRSTWIPFSPKVIPKPGWMVVFSWKSNGTPNHIGLVDHLESGALKTVEYNTSIVRGGNQRDGGVVARKTRPFEGIMGYVKTY